MRYLVTGKEMQYLDEMTSTHYGVSPELLMEQAAMQFVRTLTEQKQPCRVLVVCGFGNNGGDGIAIARLLRQASYDATIYFPLPWNEKKASKLCKMQYEIYQKYGYPIAPMIAATDSYDLVIDAIFGTGLKREVTGSYEEAILTINEMKAERIAVDIPSGISADTGEVLHAAVRADQTITFSFGKVGQFLAPGSEYSGRVIIVPVGITKESFLEKKPHFAYLEKKDFSLLPKRPMNSHKGTYGKLLLVAGNKDMAGAAVFAAKAAYRTGVGMVKILTHENNRNSILSQVPEAILITYKEQPDPANVIENLKWADAVVMGPGMGTDSTAQKILSFVMEHTAVPILLDADALNIISTDTGILLRPHTDMVVTPHIGEMARLTNGTVSYTKSRYLEVAKDFAQTYDVVCVLKDARTVTAVPYGMSYLNLSGNQGMATAGSGDVLSGIIGALLAMGVAAKTASPLGVFLHGCAGDLIAERIGKRGLMASDIINGLKILWKQVEEDGNETSASRN